MRGAEGEGGREREPRGYERGRGGVEVEDEVVERRRVRLNVDERGERGREGGGLAGFWGC